MHARWTFPGLLLLAASWPALAEPATQEGAKAIAQSYADYFSRAVVDKGIVAVTPSGEDYVVSWDLQKALDLTGAPKGALRIERFSYTLSPGEGDAWRVRADRFPDIAFEAPTDKGRVTGALALSGFRLDGVLDFAKASFLRALATAERATNHFHIADPTQGVDIEAAESGISVETRAKTADDGAGVDIAIAQSVKSLSETVVALADKDRGAPFQVTYAIDGMIGGVAITGLRAREIGDLWKFAVAHIDDAQEPTDFAQRIEAALPLWNDVQANAEFHDLSLQTQMAGATLKGLGEKLDLSGLTREGAAEIGVTIDGLAFQSTLLPAWAESLSPASFSFDVRLTDKGLGKAAQLALDDPDFADTGDLLPETQDRIAAALLDGRPTLVLAPGRLTTPMLDLAFEGEASASADASSGHFTFSADSLDKTIALLGDLAKAGPEFQAAAIGVTLLKGLATVGPDGRLVWKVDVTGDGDVSINGTPLSQGK
jgi:hypothetical protein